jgi:SAM-dependent methyltransferase
MDHQAAASWNAAYAAGHFCNEPPVRFVDDILTAARQHGLRRGIYIGCGNGRNLITLLDAGLDLIGLDISTVAIAQLHQRRPDRDDHLIVGDLSLLPDFAQYDIVVGIQVFQHGTRSQAHQHLRVAAAHVAPGGLLCVRVNATDSDIDSAHDHFEDDRDGSFTVHYLSGPKTGLDIHFFTGCELRNVIGHAFIEVLAPRLDSTPRTPPGHGQWSMWEAIWQRPADAITNDSPAQHRRHQDLRTSSPGPASSIT